MRDLPTFTADVYRFGSRWAAEIQDTLYEVVGRNLNEVCDNAIAEVAYREGMDEADVQMLYVIEGSDSQKTEVSA